MSETQREEIDRLMKTPYKQEADHAYLEWYDTTRFAFECTPAVAFRAGYLAALATYHLPYGPNWHPEDHFDQGS